jgi:hypothetical protein
MKTIKGLLLGAAAALSMGSAASAADLPAAEPVEYVRICDGYGAGFFFIPGTDTCLRISGLVRLDISWTSNDNISLAATDGIGTIGGQNGFQTLPAQIQRPIFVGGVIGGVVFPTIGAAPTVAGFGTTTLVGIPAGSFLLGDSPTGDNLVMGVRALLTFDARSRTEWGVLRSFFQFAANSNNTADNGDALQLRYGYVQFGLGAGIVTAGVTDSFFNSENSVSFGNFPGDRTTRATALAYSASFGNGISATLSLEDSEQNFGAGGSTGGIFVNGLGQAFSTEGWVRRGVELPDLVANIRVAQAWGVASLSGAITQQRYINTTCALAPTGFCSDSETGYAIGGALRVFLPGLGAGSNILVKATYADGALAYLGNVTNNSVFGTTTVAGFSTDDRIETISGYSLFGQFQVFFTPALRAAILAGYYDIDPNLNGSIGTNLVYYDRGYTISGQLVWSPVRNLDIGLEVFYVNQRFTAFAATGAFAGNAAREIGSVTDDGWGAIFRIQRSF